MRRRRAFVYIVRCSDDTLYAGIARDVPARLEKHDAGTGAKYTRSRGPVSLVWQEGPMSLGRALRREHQVKRLSRAHKLALIRGEIVLKLPRRREPARKAAVRIRSRAKSRET